MKASISADNYIENLINEIGSDKYEDIIKAGVKDSINDEITAGILYFILAEKLKGFGVENAYKEIIEHGKQENSEHALNLVRFAGIHGFVNELQPELTTDIENVKLNSKDQIINVIQQLETGARKKYEALAKLAEQQKDLTTRDFFAELVKDETDHFDDLAYIHGDIRPLGENLVERILDL